MNRKFLTNIAFLLFVNLLVKPFWIFGIDRTVQNTVGAEIYGLYFALFNFSVLFHIVLDFGINNFNNRSVARDHSFLGSNLSDILVLKLLLAFIYLIVTIVAATLLSFSTFELQLLALLAFNQILLSLLLYFRSNVSGMHLFKIDSVLSVLDRVLMILICSFLLWGQLDVAFKIEWFIYAQTASLLFALLTALLVVLIKSGKLTFSWSTSSIKTIIRNTYPYALLGLLMSVYYRVDGVMIERMLPDGAYQAGVYAAAYRLLDAANMFGFLFATILLPMFARMIAKNENVKELVSLSFRVIMIWSVFFVVTCIFYGSQIIDLLYVQSDDYWTQLFVWLMPAYLGVCTVYIYGTLLTANGSLKPLNMIALGGMILNIALNYFLISSHKAYGATIATVITQSLVAILHIIVAMKIFKWKIDHKQVVAFILFTITLIGTNYLLEAIINQWIINIAISGFIALLVSVVFGLISPNKLKSLITR